MLGIEDTYVALAYLLCLVSAVLCVVYGLITRNRGEAAAEPEDVQWAVEEKKVEEEL
jgi:hypothetical protein